MGYEFKKLSETGDPIGGGAYKFKHLSDIVNYTITPTLTNVTGAANNPTTIQQNGTATLTFTAADGYTLPEIVQCPAATATWTQATGTLVLTNPVDNVEFTIAGVAIPQLATPTNLTVDGTTATFDEVENATSYDVLIDGASIGEYTPPSGYSQIRIYAEYPGGSYGDAYYKINDGQEIYLSNTDSTTPTILTNVIKLEVKAVGNDECWVTINGTYVSGSSGGFDWIDITNNLSENCLVCIYADD